jgi:hypothetical protein
VEACAADGMGSTMQGMTLASDAPVRCSELMAGDFAGY